jgi:WD40 repeat protein
LLSRDRICVIGVLILGVAWLVNDSPVEEEDTQLKQVRGGAGVLTTSLSFSLDGSMMATTDSSGFVALRNLADGWEMGQTLDYAGIARSTAFSPDHRFLAVGGSVPGVVLWELSPARTARVLDIPIQQVKALAFSPDGRSLAASNEASGDIILWDLAEGREIMTLRGRFPAVCVAFSPDGGSFVSGEVDEKSVEIWDLATGGQRPLNRDRAGPITSIAFSPDGTLLAAASPWDRMVRLWDLKMGRLFRTLEGHVVGTNAVAFAPDGRTITTVGNDGMVRLWAVATGEQWASLNGQGICLRWVAISPDGRTLAATGYDGDLRQWQLTDVSPQLTRLLPAREGRTGVVAR